MGLAAAGYLPPVYGALLQEGIDVAVILNALRALRPVAAATPLAPADAALTQRFRAEHQGIESRYLRNLEGGDQETNQQQMYHNIKQPHRPIHLGERVRLNFVEQAEF